MSENGWTWYRSPAFFFSLETKLTVTARKPSSTLHFIGLVFPSSRQTLPLPHLDPHDFSQISHHGSRRPFTLLCSRSSTSTTRGGCGLRWGEMRELGYEPPRWSPEIWQCHHMTFDQMTNRGQLVRVIQGAATIPYSQCCFFLFAFQCLLHLDLKWRWLTGTKMIVSTDELTRNVSELGWQVTIMHILYRLAYHTIHVFGGCTTLAAWLGQILYLWND